MAFVTKKAGCPANVYFLETCFLALRQSVANRSKPTDFSATTIKAEPFSYRATRAKQMS